MLRENNTLSGQKMKNFFLGKKIALRYFIAAVAVCFIREASENKVHHFVPDLLSSATILPVP